MIWIITMVSIWAYPALAFYIVKTTSGNHGMRRKILIWAVSVSLITICGLFTGISTTSIEIDTLLVTSLYLVISLVIWIGIEAKQKIIRISLIVLSVFVFGVGYLSGTIGALGIGLVTMSSEPINVTIYEDGIIYKETPLGNAVSDFRGKEVKIYQTISWLPVVEWKLTGSRYYSVAAYRNQFKVEYLKDLRLLVLSLPDSVTDRNEHWGDTIRIP